MRLGFGSCDGMYLFFSSRHRKGGRKFGGTAGRLELELEQTARSLDFPPQNIAFYWSLSSILTANAPYTALSYTHRPRSLRPEQTRGALSDLHLFSDSFHPSILVSRREQPQRGLMSYGPPTTAGISIPHDTNPVIHLHIHAISSHWIGEGKGLYSLGLSACASGGPCTVLRGKEESVGEGRDSVLSIRRFFRDMFFSLCGLRCAPPSLLLLL